jgi:predicted MFS family arabinose efflux permease
MHRSTAYREYYDELPLMASVFHLGVRSAPISLSCLHSPTQSAGSVLAGLGFGPAFSAVFRSLAPLAPPDKRAGLLASIFIVVYLAFSVPALIAGVAVTHYGLRDTTYVYGIVVMTLAAMTAVAVWRRRGQSLRPPSQQGLRSPIARSRRR